MALVDATLTQLMNYRLTDHCIVAEEEVIDMKARDDINTQEKRAIIWGFEIDYFGIGLKFEDEKVILGGIRLEIKKIKDLIVGDAFGLSYAQLTIQITNFESPIFLCSKAPYSRKGYGFCGCVEPTQARREALSEDLPADPSRIPKHQLTVFSDLNTVTRGFVGRGYTHLAQKRYTCSVMMVMLVHNTHSAEISFTVVDPEGVLEHQETKLKYAGMLILTKHLE
ncbi:hypothetical protein VNO78_01668 [Psophocarpus tetragonolobus]|uniref:Uncharacterized protein n=1 Tax=Psophocarpus tetragonolobus TaxID=3891 RepID=A0AAN9SY49_PSOTE